MDCGACQGGGDGEREHAPVEVLSDDLGLAPAVSRAKEDLLEEPYVCLRRADGGGSRRVWHGKMGGGAGRRGLIVPI